VIPHAELRRKVPGLVSLLQVGGLRGVQDESNPSRYRPSPRTVLGPVIVGEDQDRSVCGVRSADIAPAVEASTVPNSR
jgi:hypothetical protein